MKIMHIVGARPNFIKIAPIMREMENYPDKFEQILVHTGQHYDANMSDVFFDELELPKPDVNLEVGSGTHAGQTAQIMLRFEGVLNTYKPDWIIVPGDVNSTIACALVASKLGVKIAHVEAGLRSFDRTMPEEINRVLTDQLSDLLFTPSRDGNENLLREGLSAEKIHFVGNIMIDTLVRLLPKAEGRWPALKEQFCLNRYILATFHRPSNVDNIEVFAEIIAALAEISKKVPVVFPVHPRTRIKILSLGLSFRKDNLILTEPLGYLDFLALQMKAAALLTDSGGIQEETTYLGIPCLTARPNTERPVTITHGTNQLVKSRRDAIIETTEKVLKSDILRKPGPELWDGITARRIVNIFLKDVHKPSY
ncbi:MAG TPA: UDP-N-acetylglucosamine 2-epimerase (non-hydrolyzing) [Smithella sp.]|nr:UDP-N-acetylglucosamine 2-epimerase (non-hydrolyzing) [Smithella sp.]